MARNGRDAAHHLHAPNRKRIESESCRLAHRCRSATDTGWLAQERPPNANVATRHGSTKVPMGKVRMTPTSSLHTAGQPATSCSDAGVAAIDARVTSFRFG